MHRARGNVSFRVAKVKVVRLRPLAVFIHIKWVPFHHGMLCRQDADGGSSGCGWRRRPSAWRIAENVLKNRSRPRVVLRL